MTAANRLRTENIPSNTHSNRHANRLQTASNRLRAHTLSIERVFSSARTVGRPFGRRLVQAYPPRALSNSRDTRHVRDMGALITEHPQAKTVRERPISKRLRQAIRLVLSGECATQKAAAMRVGITPEWFSKALRKDKIRAFCENETRRTIEAGQMPAAARLLKLLDARSEHVQFDASRHLLALNSITPPERGAPLVNIAITPGYVVDLRGPAPDGEELPPIVDVPPNGVVT
jgi:hypothetical protein